ncbi:MAG: hypothetical protein HYY08_03690 [Firmicutes bacterium]|nr:hypothetical protein [Bacillota bacterium]
MGCGDHDVVPWYAGGAFYLVTHSLRQLAADADHVVGEDGYPGFAVAEDQGSAE